MASVINITDKDTSISGSSIKDGISGAESKKVGGFTKHALTNRAFSKIQSYANEFVEIIHSVIEVNDEPGKCSRRNSETIYITDTVTSTVLTCSNGPAPKQESVVMLNGGRGEVGAQADGMNKSILIQTKRVLKQNINQQIEDVITESITKATAITNLNSNKTLVDGEDEAEIYTIPDHFREIHEVIIGEESDQKFGEILESVQKLEANKQHLLPQVTDKPIITTSKTPPKRTENQTDPNYMLGELDDAQDEYTATAIEFLASREKAFAEMEENVANGMEGTNEVISSAPNNRSSALTGQEEVTALIYSSDFNCSSDNPPLQMLN
ncbi:unnamed protein product [Litomosoides sigmodontis]|uniref:Uncharacterized protein n=1 Tax=Litomosoides sigmodontis TaxID=42156 RepID=A0A3P6SKH8_LITSI|nr:unnamed protein product [Litomosoides sigmodontis]